MDYFNKSVNIAFLGDSFFRIADSVRFEQGGAFWDFIEKKTDAGKYVFLYLSYEAFNGNSNELPYPLGMAWEAEPVGKKEFFEIIGHGDESAFVYNINPGKGFESYLQGFERIKAMQKEGYTYQVNYTFPLFFNFKGPWQGFALKVMNSQQTPYSGFVSFEDRAFISCSPELFFAREGDEIFAEPMKGTWPIGVEPEIDEKTSAENIMIVDLIRNDLGRVSEFESIKVDEVNKLDE